VCSSMYSAEDDWRQYAPNENWRALSRTPSGCIERRPSIAFSGRLLKRRPQLRTFCERQFVLSGEGELCYFKLAKKKSAAAGGGKAAHRIKTWGDVGSVTVFDLPENRGRRKRAHRFEVGARAGREDEDGLGLAAADAEQKQAWLAALAASGARVVRVSRAASARRSSGGSSGGSRGSSGSSSPPANGGDGGDRNSSPAAVDTFFGVGSSPAPAPVPAPAPAPASAADDFLDLNMGTGI